MRRAGEGLCGARTRRGVRPSSRAKRAGFQSVLGLYALDDDAQAAYTSAGFDKNLGSKSARVVTAVQMGE